MGKLCFDELSGAALDRVGIGYGLLRDGRGDQDYRGLIGEVQQGRRVESVGTVRVSFWTWVRLLLGLREIGVSSISSGFGGPTLQIEIRRPMKARAAG